MTTELIMTFLMGLFIPLGALIGYFTKKSEKLTNFLISIAAGVILPLVFLEIIPEVLEETKAILDPTYSYIYFIVLLISGMALLKILDNFIPDHHHHCEEEECHREIYHIGIMSFIAIFLHDFIEGMALYVTSSTSVSSGISFLIGIGFHNIPLGILLISTLNKEKHIIKTIIPIIFISLTPLIGGLLVQTNSDFFLSELILSSLLAITSGMLIYIVFFELLPHIKENRKNFIGVIIGITIMIISMLF